MDSSKKLEQLKVEIDKLKGESLEYIGRMVRSPKKRQETNARIEELFGRIKILLEDRDSDVDVESKRPSSSPGGSPSAKPGGSGKINDFEGEVRKYAQGMRVTPGVKARGVSLKKIEGIGSVTAQKLLDSGVTSVQKLLDLGASPKGRRQLAGEIGASERLILSWVNNADMMRIRGIGEEYTDLLEAAGVDTVPELAQRNPSNLFQKLVEVNEQKKLVRRLPSEAEVEAWVAQAKKLPRVIRY